MKILFAYYRYSPNTNGPSTYIQILRRELVEAGHEVDLFSHDERWTALRIGHSQRVDKLRIKESLDGRLRTQYAGGYAQWIYWRELERYSLEWAGLQMDLGGYDLIHCHDFMTARALSRAKPAHVPLVVSLHNCKFYESLITGEYDRRTEQEQRFVRAEEGFGAMSAEAVLVACEWLKRHLRILGVPEEPIEIVPYSVVQEPFLGDIAPAKGRHDIKIILCPARLVPIKGHRYLLEALHRLRQERTDFICFLAGEGSHREQLENMAAQLGLETCVTFLGKRKDMPALMAQSDMIVLPSLHDTFPYVLMEGQLSGKPVLATTVGGIGEMIADGTDGLLVPSGDGEALAAGLRLLLDDPALRESLGKQARLRALRSWTIDRHMDQIYRVYGKLAANKRPVSPRPDIGRWQPDLELLRVIGENAVRPPGGEIRGAIPMPLIDAARSIRPIIHLFDLSGVLLQTRELDGQGRFGFEGVPDGTYVLRSAFEGYQNKVVTVPAPV